MVNREVSVVRGYNFKHLFKHGDIVEVIVKRRASSVTKVIGRICVSENNIYLVHNSNKLIGGKPFKHEMMGFKYGFYLGYKREDGYIVNESSLFSIKHHPNQKYIYEENI